jgi:hypothetical protein
MSLFGWFDTGDAKAFATELAAFILADLQGRLDAGDAKFKASAERKLVQADRKVQEFKAKHALNFFTRAALANRFLWTLKDGGCPDAYADQLTNWLTLRL